MALLRRRAVEPAHHPEPHHDTVALAEAPVRQRIAVTGQVMAIRTVPSGGRPVLVVRIDDESGSATVKWTGRRAIGGITLGRRLVVEGVATADQGRLTFVNPSYTLLAR